MKSSTLDSTKPSKQEIQTYLKRKFTGTTAEATPRYVEYELEDGYEFAYILNPQGIKSVTIKKI